MSVGGSIIEVTVAGRSFAVAADADTNRDLGGYSSEWQPNGNGSGRDVKTAKGWMLTGVALSIDDTRGDHEFLQNTQNGSDVPITVTYMSGVTYQGTGNIRGDLQVASQATTATVSFGGGGTLAPQY